MCMCYVLFLLTISKYGPLTFVLCVYMGVRVIAYLFFTYLYTWGGSLTLVGPRLLSCVYLYGLLFICFYLIVHTGSWRHSCSPLCACDAQVLRQHTRMSKGNSRREQN